MKLVFFTVLFFVCYCSRAQQISDTNTPRFEPVFTKVEVEPSYPGGQKTWMRYLVKRLRYPEKAVEKLIQGTVNIQFIVDTTGAISEVEVIDGPQELREESIRLIKESAPWLPAIQNSRKVKAYKKQSIKYRLG